MLRTVLTVLVVGLLTPPIALLAMAFSLVDRPRDASIRLGRVWARALMWAMGVKPSYRGLEHARAEPPFVYIANHQSLVDILAVVMELPDSSRFVAKKELFRIPIFGWALHAGGFLPIDRGNRARAIRSLGEAARRIREGRPFVLFAEGTRSRDGRMGTFKKGAFHVALQTGATVVPIAISGSWNVLRPKKLRVRPGAVRVSFAEPIDVRPFLPDDVDGLMRRVRRAIAAGLEAEELRPEDRIHRSTGPLARSEDPS